MTERSAMWNTMVEHIPKRRWISIREIFAIVESRSTLDKEDLELNSFRIPRWRLTVRRALMDQKRLGSIQGRRKTR